MTSPHSSLHNLAHIANMSREHQALNEQMSKEDSDTEEKKPKTRPKRMACVECRQQKSKCDASEKQPNPCTRCTKKGLKCDLRSDYKRTFKRARIAQIEKEFSELKRTLTASQATELLNRIPTLSQVQGLQDLANSPSSKADPQKQLDLPSSVTNHPSFQAAMDTMNSTSTNSNPSIPNTPSIHRPPEAYPKPILTPDEYVSIPEYVLQCEEKTLDTISILPQTIKILYMEYVDHYHPILPVVDVMKGPEKLYRLCPALFWVIMFVSLRRLYDEQYRELLMRLSPVIKEILAEITISPITRYHPTEEDEPILNACSVYSVQAFLIYTYWPPITSSLSADTSWNTIGLALFHGIRIGLNAPNTPKTPQQAEMVHEQTKTWILCNIVSQNIATAFGFPAFVQFDSSVWSSFRTKQSFEFSNLIKFMLEIALFEDQITKTLNSNPMDPYGLIDPTERLPLLKVLLRQLDELELRVTHELLSSDNHRRFQILAARVHLLTYYFMDSSRIAFFELQKGLVRLFNAAISLINFAHNTTSRNKNFIRYLPGVYVLNIWQASCIIAKLIHSPLKSFIDLGSGKQAYEQAITLAAKASILKHDMAHRSSGIMRNMWLVLRSLDDKKLSSLTIDIRSRMAASVFFDCLYVLRDQVGMLKLNSRNNGESNEDGNSNEEEEDEEYGYQDNEAVESDGEKAGNETSQKSTPSSNTSSKTKKRSLSNTIDAESKARRIIRTIPLDPRPISAHNKRSNIFKIIDNSNESSPKIKPSPSAPKGVSQLQIEDFRSQTNSPPPLFTGHNRMNITGNTINRNDLRMSYPGTQVPQQTPNPGYPAGTNFYNDQTSMYGRNGKGTGINESPVQGGLENLELDTFDSDLLWKDVDSVMNDFGFHAQ